MMKKTWMLAAFVAVAFVGNVAFAKTKTQVKNETKAKQYKAAHAKPKKH